MAIDDLLKIEDDVTENRVSRSIGINGNGTRGYLKIHEASGSIDVFLEHSVDEKTFHPIPVYEVERVGLGRSIGAPKQNLSFDEPTEKIYEFYIESKRQGYIRYRYEVDGESPKFNIEINHG